MRFLLPLFIALVFLVPTKLFADSGSKLLEQDGKPGFWFPEDVATRMLADLQEFPLMKLKVGKLESKVDTMEEYERLLKLDLEVTEQIGNKWKTAFDEQVKVNAAQQKFHQKELASSKKWYRSPVLWFSVGFVMASAMAVGLTFGLAEAR